MPVTQTEGGPITRTEELFVRCVDPNGVPYMEPVTMLDVTFWLRRNGKFWPVPSDVVDTSANLARRIMSAYKESPAWTEPPR